MLLLASTKQMGREAFEQNMFEAFSCRIVLCFGVPNVRKTRKLFVIQDEEHVREMHFLFKAPPPLPT